MHLARGRFDIRHIAILTYLAAIKSLTDLLSLSRRSGRKSEHVRGSMRHTDGRAMISDLDILQKYDQSRDPDAFNQLVTRHAAMVYAAAFRVTRNAADADDVTQECFLALVRQAARVRSSVAAWSEIAPLLDQALADLPDDRRLPLIGHYLEGRTHDEITSATSWTADPPPGGIRNGPKRFAVTREENRFVIIAGCWNEGISRYVEPDSPPAHIDIQAPAGTNR